MKVKAGSVYKIEPSYIWTTSERIGYIKVLSKRKINKSKTFLKILNVYRKASDGIIYTKVTTLKESSFRSLIKGEKTTIVSEGVLAKLLLGGENNETG